MRTSRNSLWIAIPAALMGLGLSMPGCPGQQETQKKIDDLTRKQSEMERQLQALGAQVGSMRGDLGRLKAPDEQLTKNLMTQNESLMRVEGQVKELMSRPTPAPRSAPSKSNQSSKKSSTTKSSNSKNSKKKTKR